MKKPRPEPTVMASGWAEPIPFAGRAFHARRKFLAKGLTAGTLLVLYGCGDEEPETQAGAETMRPERETLIAALADLNGASPESRLAAVECVARVERLDRPYAHETNGYGRVWDLPETLAHNAKVDIFGTKYFQLWEIHSIYKTSASMPAFKFVVGDIGHLTTFDVHIRGDADA